MPQLLDLPTETLAEIATFQLYSTWRPTETLFNLCLTCRRLRDIAEPLLYHTFKTWKYDEKAVARFLSFFGRVAQTPELRKSVKHVELYLGRDRGDGRGMIPAGFDLSTLGIAERAVRSISKKWTPGNRIESWPHVLDLISLLPNLEVLRLKQKDIQGGFNMSSICEVTDQLHNLRHLELVAPRIDKTIMFGAAPLLWLQNLKQVWLKNFDISDDDHIRTITLPKNPLTIERVTIRNCLTTNAFICTLLEAIEHLLHFEYRTWADIDERDEEIDIAAWHSALCLHQDTLEELSLNCINEYRTIRVYTDQVLEPWPSFRGFSKIKSLQIEYRRTKFSHLPASLVHLYLFDCRDVSGDEEIDQWCSVKRDFCPKLQTFDIMATQHCRSIQRRVKYYRTGFKWYDWSEKTRVWVKDDFRLKVWFKEFKDGSYAFSQGTDDTGELDSNGEKIPSEEEEEEEEEEEDDDEDEEDEEEEGSV